MPELEIKRQAVYTAIIRRTPGVLSAEHRCRETLGERDANRELALIT